MSFHPDVYISLTSIPSRLNRLVRDSLLDLIQQDYDKLQQIFITLPLENMRGQKVDPKLPDWLFEEPLKSKVTISRPDKDYGPIMKWIGAHDLLPENSWVFVCDDDVRYDHHYISLCVEKAGKITDEKQRNKSLFNTSIFDNLTENVQIFSIDLIWGVHGVLVSSEFIRYIHEKFNYKLPPCCLRIDDDVVSVLARDGGYKKVPIPHGLDIGNALMNLQGDALSTSYNKLKDRHECHAIINPTYYDNLVIVICILSPVLLLLFILALTFVIMHEKKRRLINHNNNNNSMNKKKSD
jgi:hypothetical protein